jgi:hypothetical protein
MATYALIPGAGGDPWEWHLLVPELEKGGHEAIAVRPPSEDDTAGWSEYADVSSRPSATVAKSSSSPNRWALSPLPSCLRSVQWISLSCSMR